MPNIEASPVLLKDQGNPIFPMTDVSLIQGLSNELAAKQETLVSGENIKTINGQSILGSGDIQVATDISGKADKVSGATSGDLAGLDANGNLTDSGKKVGDVASTYINPNTSDASVVADPKEGDIEVFVSNNVCPNIQLNAYSTFISTNNAQSVEVHRVAVIPSVDSVGKAKLYGKTSQNGQSTLIATIQAHQGTDVFPGIVFIDANNVMHNADDEYISLVKQEFVGWRTYYTFIQIVDERTGDENSILASVDINGIRPKVVNEYYNGEWRTREYIEPSDFATAAQGALADTAYQKPLSGIPSTDLAEGTIPDVSTFITKSVNDLTNYYLKSETYTKSEVQSLIGAINQFRYEIYASVAYIPTPANNVLYLIGPIGSGTDKYEEYVYVQSDFIKIGETSIDLSGYITTSALNTALADYTTTANLTTLLAGKQDTISDLSTIRSGAAAGATAYQKPQTGIPASDIASGVIPDVSGKENSSNKVTSLSAQSTDTQYPSAKATYDAINPSVQSSQPVGGFEPMVVYKLGTLTGTVTFALASPTDNAVPNPYKWTFETGSTAPTVNWPLNIIWPKGFTPEVDTNCHYEITVEDGYAAMLVYELPTS